MSSTQFTVDMQDIEFALFDVVDMAEKLKNIPRYAEFDRPTYVAMLEEAERMAVDVLAPINGTGDRQGCTLDAEGNVTTPDGYPEAWRTMTENGWVGMSAPSECGGIGLPYPMALAANEMFTGACMAFTMYMGLAVGAARVIHHYGSEEQKSMYVERMFAGEWAGTMCLTEAGAGTAVGDNRCKAIRTEEEGVYHLEGEKIFISGADNNFTENVIHLVLARTPDAPAGSKGISIFIVPKFHVGANGELGARNDARVVGLEHKMGINGSCTCVLALGTQEPCTGYIIGEEGQGLTIMFQLMNEARIGVGGQGQAMAAAAYNYSVAYANERIQGTALKNMKDANAERIPIVQHADVRRMLMTQKVLVETMRSLLYRVATDVNLVESGTLEESEAKAIQGRVDLLVPIIKAHCTDLGCHVCETAVQIYGGYGYTQEYPVEQLVRDAKIMTIYEGTNGVQALDLLGRKMRTKGGALFMGWLQYAQGLVAEHANDFSSECQQIGKALQHLGATAMHLGTVGATGDIEGTMLHATPFQTQFGHIVLALEALQQAATAKRLSAERGESNFYTGKLRNLSFYVSHILPQSVSIAKSIQSGDKSCLDACLFQA